MSNIPVWDGIPMPHEPLLERKAGRWETGTRLELDGWRNTISALSPPSLYALI